jgi:hypothetical protein
MALQRLGHEATSSLCHGSASLRTTDPRARQGHATSP